MKHLDIQNRADRTTRLYEIRNARTPAEKEKIYRLRYQVYVEEMRRPQHFALHDQGLIAEPLDETAALLGAFSEERALGTCRVNFSDNCEFENRAVYDFDSLEKQYPKRVAFVTKMIVAPEYRRSMLFAELSRAVYRVVAARGCRVMVIDCNDHLVNAFLRQGFLPYRGKVEHPDYGMVTPMVLFIQDEEHLQKVRSPFLDICREFFPHSTGVSQ